MTSRTPRGSRKPQGSCGADARRSCPHHRIRVVPGGVGGAPGIDPAAGVRPAPRGFSKFSLDALVGTACKLGIHVRIELGQDCALTA